VNKKVYCIGIDEVGRAASKRRASPHYTIGIDEVGRGPLAGPVVVAAVALPSGIRLKPGNGRLPLKDSKKLTALQRNRWQEHLCSQPEIFFSVAYSYPPIIDRINISRAANSAACRAYLRVLKNLGIGISRAPAYLDGGLYLGNGKRRLAAKTVIKGDEKINSIKAASIIAKVSRDRAMVRLAKQYPRYGFEIHKGYGTRRHMRALKKYGASKAHRKSFLKSLRA
jgi:ribonuclease HII